MNPAVRQLRRAGTCIVTIVAGLLALRGDALAQGCAMCRTALGGADDPLARGFYDSILFLMSAPYLVAGSIGAWLIHRHVVASRHASGVSQRIEEIPETVADAHPESS